MKCHIFSTWYFIPYSGSIIRVLQFLDKSLEHSEHTHHDFYASELAGCLSRLAGHNSNKTMVRKNLRNYRCFLYREEFSFAKFGVGFKKLFVRQSFCL